MTEPAISEAAIGDRIRRLADAGVASRDPTAIVAAVLAHEGGGRRSWRRPAILASFAAVALLAVVGATGLLVPSGSSPATARIGGIRLWGIDLGGTTYAVAVARDIDLADAELTPYAQLTQNSGIPTIGDTAYRVDDLDPSQVLVMRVAEGQTDDAGSIGDYLVLVRGDGFFLLCDYFPPGALLAPTRCDR